MVAHRVNEFGVAFDVVTVEVCNLCRSPLEGARSIKVDSCWGPSSTFEIVQCAKCELGHTQPRPTSESIGLLYESKGDEVAKLSSLDFDPDTSRLFTRLKDYVALRELRSRIGQSRVTLALDYGAGNGRFANQIRLLTNAEVTAVDYQVERPSSLRPEIGYVTVDEFLDTDELYDVIFLRHVLEHTSDPVELLKNLAVRLTEGGRIFIEVPNLDSTTGRIVGRNWVGRYAPKHIHHFTRQALTLAVREAGLHGVVEKAEMPLMGNQLARSLGARDYTLPFKLAGVLLHPIQLLLEIAGRTSTVLRVTATRS